MVERVAHEFVTFPEAFFVEGLEREQAAGTYRVETIEESIDGLSFLAYRVVSTSIELPVPRAGPHSFQQVRINSELVRETLRTAKLRE